MSYTVLARMRIIKENRFTIIEFLTGFSLLKNKYGD